MRALLIALALVVCSASMAVAQTSTPSTPSTSVTVAQDGGGWAIIGSGLPAQQTVTLVVFALDGTQSVRTATTSSNGALSVDLVPPENAWFPGVYRAVVGLPDHTALSVLFVADVAGPSLFAQPAVTSPYSALNIIGTGLAPNADVVLVVHPANLRSPRAFVAHTDASGSFSYYVWPEDLNETFFEVGSYVVDAPDLNLSAQFSVYEEPVSSHIAPIPDTTAGNPITISTSLYRPGRYLWGLYQSTDRSVQSQFLIGPTDDAGRTSAAVRLPEDLPAGLYRLATPYDWGWTDFTVLAPPTNTPTSTDTPTATPTETPTSTPTPTPVRRAKKHCHKVHGKRRCTRK